MKIKLKELKFRDVKWFVARAPTATRKSFGIQVKMLDGTFNTLDLPELVKINQLFKKQILHFSEATTQVQEVLKSLYARRDKLQSSRNFNPDNQRLLADYWETHYSDRDLVDADSMRYDLERAVAAVGTHSLVASSREDLQKAVNGESPTKQRRIVTRLNQLLKHLGRDFQLRKLRPVQTHVDYLSLADFKTVVSHIEEPSFATLCQVAFATGCRVGEIFALTSRDLTDSHLRVTSQLDTELRSRETKNRKKRRAYVLPEFRPAITAWLAIPTAEKASLRLVKHSRLFRAACQKAFPGSPEKHVHFHALRHSYAVHLVGLGVPLSLVAQSLGNSIAVCELHYSGFVLSDLGVEGIDSIVKGRSPGA